MIMIMIITIIILILILIILLVIIMTMMIIMIMLIMITNLLINIIIIWMHPEVCPAAEGFVAPTVTSTSSQRRAHVSRVDVVGCRSKSRSFSGEVEERFPRSACNEHFARRRSCSLGKGPATKRRQAGWWHAADPRRRPFLVLT